MTETPADQPDQTNQPLTVHRFPEKLAVVRLGPGAEVPSWAESSSVFSITATAAETALVCAGRSVPTKVPAHRGLIAFTVPGELLPSPAAALLTLMAAAAEDGVETLPVITHDTCWLLVPGPDADDAEEAWRRRGHTVAPAPVR